MCTDCSINYTMLSSSFANWRFSAIVLFLGTSDLLGSLDLEKCTVCVEGLMAQPR